MEHKKTRKASLVVADKIIETVYDPKQQQTKFAIYEGGEVCYVDSVKIGKDEISPLDARNDLVRKNVILLPSAASGYVTEEELLGEIQVFIHRYLEISPMFEQIAAYYVLFSWMYDRFYEVPYLRAIGDFGSGKSRLLQTVGSICYRPIFTGGATTPSPIFRILNDIGGTLILDEADFRSSDMSDDIVKILNTGYQKGSSVLRAEGKGVFEVKAYGVFGPKIVATRETFKDKALESRFLVEEMGRGTLRKDIPRRLSDEFYSQALEIRNKLLMWRFRNYYKVLVYDEEPIEGIHPRLHQIIIPLLAIIESEEMKVALKEFVKKYNTELVADRGLSRESDIVFAVFKLIHDTGKKELTVGEIANYVNEDSDISDEHIAPRKIGWYLRSRMQLKPYKTRKGFVLDIERNMERLLYWKGRYGITDADIRGEHVNDVNNDEDDVQEYVAQKYPQPMDF